MPNINYNHLYYFHIIASCGSLAKASKELSVTQPTLSQQLKVFEDQLGTRLFDRKGRNLKLNSSGMYIYEYTQQIFSLTQKMILGHSYNQKISVSKMYKIALTPTVSRLFAVRLLMPLIKRVDIGIKIFELELDAAVDKLHKLELDLIICEQPPLPSLSKAIEATSIHDPTYAFVCGKELNTRKIVTPQDLEDLPYFKYSSNASIQQEVDRYFYKHSIYPSIVGESDDLGVMIHATQSAGCFSVMPISTIEDHIKSKELFIIQQFPSAQTTICALKLKDISTKHLESIINLIKISSSDLD